MADNFFSNVQLKDGTIVNVKDTTARELLEGKVDKVTGKGLSTNDFTDALLTKLNGIQAGAEVNVQADWNVTDSSSDAYIKNKPTIPPGVTVDSALSSTSTNPVQNRIINSALDGKVDKVAGKGLSTNDFTNTYKTKLDGISAGAQVNVIESVSQNGTPLTITEKGVNVTVPTKVSDLTNDSNFVSVSYDSTNERIVFA